MTIPKHIIWALLHSGFKADRIARWFRLSEADVLEASNIYANELQVIVTNKMREEVVVRGDARDE